MNLQDHILLWNKALIEIIDIRQSSFCPGDAKVRYTLPASAYLFVKRGSTSGLIDGISLTFESTHVIHGGKGMNIELLLAEEILEYYLVLYRSILALPARKNLLAIIERSDPFNQQYHFFPGNPLPLLDKLNTMFQEWQKASPLEQLHVKSLFYQWVYELLRQLHSQDIQTLKPDPLDLAVHYMQNYYHEPITLENWPKL